MNQKLTAVVMVFANLYPPVFAEEKAAEVKPVILFPALVSEWKQCGPGSFIVKDGIATTHGGMGMWWFSSRMFQNATFKVEFKQAIPAANSGLFVRFPNPGNDRWVSVKQGYEVQIGLHAVPKYTMGGVFDVQPPTHNAKLHNGDWNTYSITTYGQEIYIVLNGELVNVVPTLKGRGEKEGYFGIQNHDPKSIVSYRHISVRPWPVSVSLAEALKAAGITPEMLHRYQLRRSAQLKKIPAL